MVNLCLSSRGDVKIKGTALSRQFAGVGLYDEINGSNMGRLGAGMHLCAATRYVRPTDQGGVYHMLKGWVGTDDYRV